MAPTPLISVILPAFNADKYIVESVESILNQTNGDFELLVFDDASTDSTKKLLQSFKDARIKIFSSSENKGLTHWLNAGIIEANGKFIARMDADDISLPMRFERQLEIFEKIPQIGIVGSAVELIGQNNESGVWSYPENHSSIVDQLFFDSPFAHPSIMMRAEVLGQNNLGYDISFEPCEDYELWFRLLKFTKSYNIQTPLLKYRLHQNQSLATKKQHRFQQQQKILKKVVEEYCGFTPSEEELKIHQSQFVSKEKPNDIVQFNEYRLKLNNALSRQKKFTLRKKVNEIWYGLMNNKCKLSFGDISSFFDKRIVDDLGLSLTAKGIVKSATNFSTKL